MMLDAILPALTNLPRAGQPQAAGQPVDGDRPGFAQLLLQAGAQTAGQPEAPIQTALFATGTAGKPNLLAQLIAEHNGFRSPGETLPDTLPDTLASLEDIAQELAPDTTAGMELTTAPLGQPGSPQEPTQQRPDSDDAWPALEPALEPEPVAANLDAVPVAAREASAAEDRPVAVARPELAQNLAQQAVDRTTARSAGGTPEPLRTEAPLPQLGAGADSQAFQPAAGIQAATPASALPAAPPAQAPTLTAPVATPEWNQQLGQQIVVAARGDEQRISMRLNPAELGPLQVELKVVDQQAQIQFLSSHAQVRGAVEMALPQLRDALAEQGITLGDTSVGEQRDGQQQADSGQRWADNRGAVAADTDDEVATAATQIPADGRVNVYV